MKVELIADALRRAILTGRYRPGQRLGQIRTAAELGVSPTPVREALRQLEAEGLVVHTPHRGTRVSEFTLEQVEEVYRVRAVLEGLVARLAVERARPGPLDDLVQRLERVQEDLESRLRTNNLRRWVALNDEFHDAILSAANAPTIVPLLVRLRSALPRDVLGLVPGQPGRTAREHRLVLECIKQGNAEGAEQALRDHVERAGVARVGFLREGARVLTPGGDVT